MEAQDIIQQLVIELRRGTQIIAVLSQLQDNAYGYALLQSLEDKGFSIEAGTLYPLMRRLESQGLLESAWDTTESRPRKYYVLSKLGITVLDALKSEWKSIDQQMRTLLEV
jgi:PadR family transcriptional regulator, regulatory protein PadR